MSHLPHPVSPTRRRLLAALATLSAMPAMAWAQPDLSRKLGPTIADTGSASYRFEHLALRSADGRRGYRLVIGVPRQAAPAAGYPAIVLLDGNAALAAMDETMLAALLAGQAPLLVAVGYDTDLRFDVQARAFDYTPPLSAGQVDEEVARGRQGGGAEVFMALLQGEVLPRARAVAPIDAARMTIWGHSYGGLFVLHTLFSQPQLFSRYVAASPSLWWGQGVILHEEQTFLAGNKAAANGKQLWLMSGDEERRAHTAAAPALSAAAVAVPPRALPEMAGRLRQQAGMMVDWRVFPGLSHGPMLPASLGPALRIAAALPPFIDPV